MNSMMEKMESRTLLSAVWTTEDDFAYSSNAYAEAEDMAPDGAGGVYAVGGGRDYSNGQGFAVVRHKMSGSSEWQTVATLLGPVGGAFVARFDAVAVAPTGEVYVAGSVNNSGTNANIWKGTLNADGTALSLSVVDTPSLGTWRYFQDLGIDSAGNVFAVGFYSSDPGNTSQHWFVRKQAGGQGAFATVDDYLYNKADARAWGVTTVPGGDVYVVGVGGGGAHGSDLGAHWTVRKSINGGGTWSTVDSFQLDPSNNAPARAREVTVADDGTLHVVGTVATRVRTGGTDRKPTYGYTQRWYMRSSGSGGSSWSNDDVFPENSISFFLGQAWESGFDPEGVVTDESGMIYVAGELRGSPSQSIVRTNATGGWSTSDSYPASNEGTDGHANCLTRDSAGTIYVGGQVLDPSGDHWFVRSMNPVTTAPGGTFSTLSTIGGSSDTSDYLMDLLS